MEIKLSYETEFTELIQGLYQKYGEEMFRLEGISGEQLDINRNAKAFLENTTTTADVSVDANANVDTRDVIGYQFELPKPLFRLNSLYLLWKQLKKDHPEKAAEIIEDQISGRIYINDFSDFGRPYCFNFSCYDIVLEGLPMIKKIKSVAPKSLFSFKSQIEQFIIVAANSTLGATGLADLFICMSLYANKILSSSRDGHIRLNWISLRDYVKETITSLIYTLNQPMRGNQSPFTNVSLYDREFLHELCPSYVLDGIEADPKIVSWLQEIYLEVMNEELRRTPITFPVTTACFTVKDGEIQDDAFRRTIAEANLEWGFINIYCGSTSTLSSCCRLRSESDNEYFNSFGAGSTKIGSLGVVTLNLPRLAWEADGNFDTFLDLTRYAAEKACLINAAKRTILKKRIDAGNMPLYTHGHMALSKQYSTIGVVGLYEAIEILGYGIETKQGEADAITTIFALNGVVAWGQRTFNAPHNLEQVPAESSAVKLADKDYVSGFNLRPDWWEPVEDKLYPYYSNQFIPLTANVDMLERIRLQGMFDKHFSGGAICHINVEERIQDASDIEMLIDHCAANGVVYWAVNYVIKECENGHMGVSHSDVCSCGGSYTRSFTRVVGFLTNVNNWNKVRRTKDFPNRQFYKE